MCFDMAGQIEAIGGFSYNTDVVAHDEVSLRTPSGGDIVLFDWDRDGPRDQGIVEANLGNGWLQTIEVIPLRLTQDRRVPEMVSTAATTASTACFDLNGLTNLPKSLPKELNR